MKKKLLAAVVTVSFFTGLGGIANATIIETFVTGTYSAGNTIGDTIWQDGDSVTFSYIYDNQSTTMTIWGDGANGLAENGLNDDYDTDPGYYDTTTNFPTFLYFDDAEFTFDSGLLSLIGITEDGTTTSRAWAHGNTTADLAAFVADGFYLNFYYPTNLEIEFDVSGLVGAQWYNIDFTDPQITSSSISTVPEPATLLLFGTGLAGLAGSRLRRKKKA